MDKPWTVQRRQLTDDVLRSDLLALEEEHRMTSAEFLRRYNRGEFGHDVAYVRWSGLLAIAAKTGVELPAFA